MQKQNIQIDIWQTEHSSVGGWRWWWEGWEGWVEHDFIGVNVI